MCKFVNTLSGKNAQSSALGASATARFRPHPLYALRAFFPASASPSSEGEGNTALLRISDTKACGLSRTPQSGVRGGLERHCKDTSFPPLLLRIVRNHAPYMALRQPKPFPRLGVCPHKRHSLPYQSVIHLANRLVALLYLVSISVHNSKVRWI